VAQAATSSVTLSVNATLTIAATSYSASGTATLTGAIAANGTFSVPNLSLTGSASPFTITLPAGTLTGSITIPQAVLTAILSGQTSASGATATITSGTGTYAGDTGTIPNLAGSGSVGLSGISVNFSGTGTITTGGVVGPPTPTVTAVLDAASNTANVAQGTIFIVKGTALCSVTTLTEYSVPRPAVGSDGVTIAFTPAAGGTATDALLWYEDPLSGGACQLAGILPSSVAPGNYTVTVTNKTASAPFAVSVVQSKFALFTQDSTGTGLAVAQNQSDAYALNRLTTGTVNGIAISPAHPGDYMVAYGTGMGGYAAGDNAASPVYDFTKNGSSVSVVIGGATIPVLFAGLAGYAGEDQINFQLPASIPTGCAVSFQISVNGTLSPATTISIAPVGGSACVLAGYTTAQLTALDNGGTITSGGFSLSQFNETIAQLGAITSASAYGGFTELSGFQLGSLASAPGSFSESTIGSCTVLQATVGTSGQITVAGSVTNLDAGTVTLSGPAASNLNKTAMTDTSGTYSLTIGETGINVPGQPTGTLAAGTYTVAGAGGTGVGAFNASITLGTPLSVTGGLPTTVNRSSPLTIDWTGGAATDVVTIIGYSGTTSGTGAAQVSTVTEFVCTTTAGTGGFTISPQVLGQLQATPATTAGGTGVLELSSGPAPVSFAPTLTGSSTTVASTLSASVGTLSTVTYQ
jgi:uncharacterized protein (TIGR03437 family)